MNYYFLLLLALLLPLTALCADDQLALNSTVEKEYESISNKLSDEMKRGNFAYIYRYTPVAGMMAGNQDAVNQIREEYIKGAEKINDTYRWLGHKHLQSTFVCGFTVEGTSLIFENWKFSSERDHELNEYLENISEDMVYIKYKNNWFIGKNGPNTYRFFEVLIPSTHENDDAEKQRQETFLNHPCVKRVKYK